MPITKQQVQKEVNKAKEISKKVEEFLAKNPDHGYTAGEIAYELGLDKDENYVQDACFLLHRDGTIAATRFKEWVHYSKNELTDVQDME